MVRMVNWCTYCYTKRRAGHSQNGLRIAVSLIVRTLKRGIKIAAHGILLLAISFIQFMVAQLSC